ncbi:hypothetical protein ACN6LI_003721, partial [Streptomyces violaceoruber]
MEREPRKKVRAGRWLGASAVLGTGAGVLAWLSPGGLGHERSGHARADQPAEARHREGERVLPGGEPQVA